MILLALEAFYAASLSESKPSRLGNKALSGGGCLRDSTGAQKPPVSREAWELCDSRVSDKRPRARLLLRQIGDA